MKDDRGFTVRASMTFSEHAHPAFVGILRGLSSRARSRLIHALVERGLSIGVAGESPVGLSHDVLVSPRSARHGEPSPLQALGSQDSLAGAEELGA